MSLRGIVAGALTHLVLLLAGYCWPSELGTWFAAATVVAPGLAVGLCAPRGRRLGTGAALALALLVCYVPRMGYAAAYALPLIPALTAAGVGLGAYLAGLVDGQRVAARAPAVLVLLIAAEFGYALVALDLWLVLSRSSPAERTTDHAQPPPRFFPDPEERVQALLAIAEREGRAGRREDARRVLHKALRAGDASADTEGRHVGRVAAALIAQGFEDEAEALMRARSSGDRQLHFQLAGHYLAGGNTARAKEHARAIPDPGYKITALCSVAEREAKSGRGTEARRTFSEAYALAADPGLLNRGFRYARDVAISQARAGFYEEAAAGVRERCAPEDRDYAWAALGTIAAQAGAAAPARSAFAQAEASARALPAGNRRSNALSGLAVKQAEAGMFDGAAETAARIEDASARQLTRERIAAARPVGR